MFIICHGCVCRFLEQLRAQIVRFQSPFPDKILQRLSLFPLWVLVNGKALYIICFFQSARLRTTSSITSWEVRVRAVWFTPSGCHRVSPLCGELEQFNEFISHYIMSHLLLVFIAQVFSHLDFLIFVMLYVVILIHRHKHVKACKYMDQPLAAQSRELISLYFNKKKLDHKIIIPLLFKRIMAPGNLHLIKLWDTKRFQPRVTLQFKWHLEIYLKPYWVTTDQWPHCSHVTVMLTVWSTTDMMWTPSKAATQLFNRSQCFFFYLINWSAKEPKQLQMCHRLNTALQFK